MEQKIEKCHNDVQFREFLGQGCKEKYENEHISLEDGIQNTIAFCEKMIGYIVEDEKQMEKETEI